jgi:nitrite reductase/ring-hydroxylating ferredoxin subunit
MNEGYTKVGQISDFPVDSLKRVRVGNDDVVVANVDGKLCAITASCTHRGGPLEEGEVQGTVVICPWHGGQFDLATGKVVSPPPTKDAIPFEVKVEGADVMLRRK